MDRIGYNTDNSHDEYVDIVKMDEQKPLGDPSCKHEKLKRDESDLLGDAVYHECANPECIVGFYIQL